MPSAAEQLAANFSLSNLGKSQELRQRIFFTLGAPYNCWKEFCF